VTDDPATGLTRFLFPPTNADRPEVRVDRRGATYVVDAAGETVPVGERLCAAISSYTISPSRDSVDLHCTPMGALVDEEHPYLESDLVMHLITPMPERLAHHIPMRPVGSIVREDCEEMVFYFMYDLVRECASLKRGGIYNFTILVSPSADALVREGRRARRLRRAGIRRSAPVPGINNFAHPDYQALPPSYDNDTARLYSDAMAWRMAMSLHTAPETARVLLCHSLFGPASAGSPTIVDAEAWTNYMARTNEDSRQHASARPMANTLFDGQDGDFESSDGGDDL
jgi:hypothetical protein